jgi:hypothetical protein
MLCALWTPPDSPGTWTASGLTGGSEIKVASLSYGIERDGGSYTVDFVQEMGRYWTGEDVKRAISQEVARQY